jgi:hypothetical protein
LRRAWSAEVRAALGEALLSRDRQQRHLAAVLLRDDDAHPTPELCTVSVEALDREVSRALVATLWHEGVAGAARYLARHAPAALTALRYGLGSTDAQQRFLCAFLLTGAGERADAGLIARELIAHLGDNEIAGDAMMAAHGLYRLARSAPVALQSWLPHVDGQARSLLELVALDLEAPPRDRRELVARRRLHRVTDVYHDPVLEFDIERSRVPTW